MLMSRPEEDPFRPITKLQVSELALDVGVYIYKANFGHKKMHLKILALAVKFPPITTI